MGLSQLLSLHGFITALALLVYVLSTHVMRQRRSPAGAIAWILFILLVPYVALPAYLAFGSRKQVRSHGAAHAPSPPIVASRDWAEDLAAALGQPRAAAYRDFRLHPDGRAAWAALLDAIDNARVSLDICTFILGRDAVGEALVQRLRKAAHAGVRVRLLLDGLGGLMSPPPDLQPLREAGVEVRRFVPPLHSPWRGRANLRDHRKLLVADAGLPTAHLWCGGRNLAAEYFEGLPGQTPWHDLSLDLAGPLVAQAHDLFEADWRFAGDEPAAAPSPTGEPARTEGGAQLVASGPDQEDDTVYALLLAAAFRAERRIVLATPYFVPDAPLLMALCLAARRGVAVELLLPARSNHRMSDFVRSRALRALAAAGAQVRLAPTMLHAKLAVFDDTLALAGSANLDSRSLFLNYELMLAFHAAADVRQFAAWFAAESASAKDYVPDVPTIGRDLAEGMLLWVGFQI